MTPLALSPLLRRLSPLLSHRTNLTITAQSISGTVHFHDELSTTSPPRWQTQTRPPPGRLMRRRRRPADSSLGAPDVSLVDKQNTINYVSSSQGPANKSRIDERREAIAKRRLFLEKGASFLTTSTQKEESYSPNNPAEKIEEPSNELHEQSASRPSMTTNIPNNKTRTSVHSLNDGRKLSAADMHRLQRISSTRPDAAIPQQHQQPTLQQQHPSPTLQHHQHNVNNNNNNKPIGRISREIRHPTGGSIVASQSATARYRMQRRAQRPSHEEESMVGGAKLKTNPSEWSIPLDDGEASTRVVSSQEEDFDERLKKIRRAQREKAEMGDGEGGVKEGWSLFGWLLGKK
ncbi:hypothetical protein HJC23_002618 [Cyclotella cryptica]|uniref:Uncharacterized protein n=1 Tax=Cyclotella cryptica TaxID=29204 RepID=A0ABD3PZI5_9STRA|eukprot:CCRYP_010362-RA/>CCRYP_010362-RA protein AED:0.26 eAED:0.26 QI:0/-1/0/1/-1/1/1/0/346